MKLSIDYCIWHNKNIPAIYLQVYDFFSFFSFRRSQKTGKRAHSLPMKNFYHVH